MHKVFQKQRLLLLLPGFFLFIAFLLVGGKAYARGEGSTGLYMGMDTEGEGASTTLIAQACTVKQNEPEFNRITTVNKDDVVCGNLTLFGGAAFVHGEVSGDVIAFGGNVVVDGQVTGNLTVYGGNLNTPPGSSVNGNIRICGGNWEGNENIALHGSVISCSTGIQTVIENSTGNAFRFWSLLTWSILGTLLTLFLPEHVVIVRATIKNKMRRSFVLGLLSVLLAPIVLTVLIALIISLPLAIFLVIVLSLAWILGTVAIGRMVGEYILHLCAPQQKNPIMQVVLGLIVLILISSLPYIGWVVSIGVGVLGLGAVMLSRFGTRFYGQPKQLLPL